MVLIKDNHIDFAGSITAAVQRVRASGNDAAELKLRHVRWTMYARRWRSESSGFSSITCRPETMREAVEMADGTSKTRGVWQRYAR